MVEPLVVIVDGNREHLLGVILTNHIVVENLADFLRRRNAVARLDQRGFVLLADDIHAQFDALVANENGRTSNELAHFVLALAAERAVEGVLGITAADFAHSILRHTLPYSPWSATPRSSAVTHTEASFAPGLQHGGPNSGKARTPVSPHHKRSMLTT